MIGTGPFRIYFNRHGDAPYVWCIEVDRTEVPIREFRIERGVIVVGCYQPKDTADDDDGIPSAWIACTGIVDILDGFAVVKHDGSTSSVLAFDLTSYPRVRPSARLEWIWPPESP